MAKRRTIQVGRVRARELSDPDAAGCSRWRAEWYPEGGGGRMATRSLGRCDPGEAEARAARLLLEDLDAAPSGRTSDGATVETVRDLLAYWLGEQRQRRDRGEIRPATFDGYRYSVGRLVGSRDDPRPLRQVRLGAVTGRRVRTERDRRAAQGDTASTVRVDLIVLRAALTWGSELGLCAAPEWDLPTVDAERGGVGYQKRTPSHAEIAAVHAELRVDWQRRLHLLLWRTGARLGEGTSATWAGVDREACTVTLDGKTGARVVPVAPEVLQAMAPGIGGALLIGQGRPVHSTFHSALEKASRRAGVQRYSAHGLRRRRTVDLMEAGVRPAVYEALMGHSWAMGVRDYDRPQVEDLAAAVRRIEG